jgi:hypothetical protein
MKTTAIMLGLILIANAIEPINNLSPVIRFGIGFILGSCIIMDFITFIKEINKK